MLIFQSSHYAERPRNQLNLGLNGRTERLSHVIDLICITTGARQNKQENQCKHHSVEKESMNLDEQDLVRCTRMPILITTYRQSN